ncbi:MAG: hypothetical protein RSB67_02125 [Clostridia bacterium]
MNIKIGDKKLGISLILLVITIVITIILTTAIIISVNTSKNNAALVSFAEEISTIEDQVSSYYIQNDEIPYLDSEMPISQKALMDLIPLSDKNIFTQELELNLDKNTNEMLGAFYFIDLSKIDITNSKKGYKKSGENNDVYVVAYPSMNVYYLKGIKVNKNKYFSFTSKISDITKLNQTNTLSDSSTTVQTVNGITVRKLNKKWTNSLDLTIDSYIEDGEELYLYIQGGNKIKLNTTKKSTNKISFNTFDELVTKGISTSILASDKLNFESASLNDKKIEITKEKSGEEVGRVEVKYSNYDNVSPVINQDTIIKISDMKNVISFKISDESSGIKEVRYEYLKKYNKKGEIACFYSGITEYDEIYMKSRAKKAKISSSGYVEIEIPKEIEGIQINIFDKSGNKINMIRNTSDNMYIGLNVKYFKGEILRYSLVFGLKSGLSDVSVSVSLDNNIYTNIYSDIKNVPISEKTFLIQNLEKLDIKNITDKLYIKIVAKDNPTNVADKKIFTRIFEFDIDTDGINNISDDWDNNKGINKPVLMDGMIPVEYNISTNKWDEVPQNRIGSGDWYNYSLVQGSKMWANARTPDGSYWVWIPRFEYKIIQAPKMISSSSYGTIQINFIPTSQTLPTISDYIIHPAFTDDSINSFKNGGWDSELDGFWVSKYKMSGELNAANNLPGNVNISNTLKAVSKPTLECWTNIELQNSYNNALKYSLFNSLSDYDSHLMKNSEWGAVAYLSRSEYGSEYGRGTQTTDINNTRYSGGSNIESEVYTKNTALSSTGSPYGIYDMSSKIGEAMASATDRNTIFRESNKYITLYPQDIDSPIFTINNSKIGDATYEVQSSNNNLLSWNEDLCGGVNSEYNFNFFVRGGYIVFNSTNPPFVLQSTPSQAGSFSSVALPTTNDNNVGYRVVLCPIK